MITVSPKALFNLAVITFLVGLAAGTVLGFMFGTG